MIYEYKCNNCGHYFTMIRPVKEYREPGKCPSCDSDAPKIFSKPNFNMNGTGKNKRIKDGFKAGWNPALGCHVGGPKEYSRILNERGLEEVGKEKLDGRKQRTNIFTDSFFKEMHNKGVKLSGEEVKALKEDRVDVNLESKEDKKEYDKYIAETKPMVNK